MCRMHSWQLSQFVRRGGARLRLLDEPKLLLGCQQPVEDPITVLAFEAALLTRDREVRLSA